MACACGGKMRWMRRRPAEVSASRTTRRSVPLCRRRTSPRFTSLSTTYVDKLVKRGLVRRRHSGSDRRVVLLALTPAGRRLIRRIFPPHAHAMRRAVAALPPSDQARTVRLLRALGFGGAKPLGAQVAGELPP